MSKETSKIRDDIKETREHMTGLMDSIATKLDARSFAKRHALLLGSAAVTVGLVVGISVWRMKRASGRDSD